MRLQYTSKEGTIGYCEIGEYMGNCLYVVVPCYNEAETLEVSSRILCCKLRELIDANLIAENSKIVFVDDGSTDCTWNIISDVYKKETFVLGIRLAHNRGHQNALLAGLMYAKKHADITISIDADLQQDVNAMEEFLKEWENGNDIVYGVRNSRDTDDFFKRITAGFFYKICHLLGCNLYTNAADYRLMSKKALNALEEYGEVNLFLRGIIPDMGFQTSVVHFDVSPRMYGESKYTFGKMLKLAMDGITSFSVRPIRMIFFLGVISLLVAVVMIVHVFYEYYFGHTVSGWSSILVSIWILGGLVLLSLGIIGEYLGRNYLETKRRPRYFVSDILD